MKIEVIAGGSIPELTEKINKFLEAKKDIWFAYQPAIMFNPFEKEWCCVIWYNDKKKVL